MAAGLPTSSPDSRCATPRSTSSSPTPAASPKSGPTASSPQRSPTRQTRARTADPATPPPGDLAGTGAKPVEVAADGTACRHAVSSLLGVILASGVRVTKYEGNGRRSHNSSKWPMWARSQTSSDWSGEIWRVSCSSESGANRSSVRRRARSRATSSDGDTELGEAGEDERGDHRAFSNRGGHTLRRAVTDIACGEEPHAAGLERERIASERPAVRRARCEEILSSQDVAGGIGEDVLARAPVGVWTTADA